MGIKTVSYNPDNPFGTRHDGCWGLYLKNIIKEEMLSLAETGDINLVSESERKVFKIILEKLSDDDLRQLGLRKLI